MSDSHGGPREARRTLSSKVRDLILDGIRSGEFAPGARVPTERQLCERCGVSRITVRSALLSLAQEGIVNRRAGSGTYVSENGLRKGTIAFLRCQHGQRPHEIRSDFVYSEILEGIQSELLSVGMHLLFSYVREEAQDDTFLDAFLGKADGVIFGEMRNQSFYKRVVSKRVPFLLINPEFPDYDVDTVDYDNLAGATRATEHLIGLGHRSIGFVNGRMPTRHALERLAGYKAALEGHGIPFSSDLVRGGSDWQSETGQAAAAGLLGRDPPVTAVFAANDSLAVGVIKGFREAGVKVPEDVSVVGFDDMVIASYSEPTLTTMRVDRHAMGAAATRRLLDIIRSAQNQKTKTLFVPELIVRNSSGPNQRSLPMGPP